MRFKLSPFFHWIKSYVSDKPWLVVGKGPSFERIKELNLDDYNVVALNHVMFQIPCLLGHAIDLDVHTEASGFKCKYLVCPWEPHISFKPGGKSLVDIMMLGGLKFEEVLYYNSSRTNKKTLKTMGPTVRVKLFGSVAVMNLLAMAGIKKIYTIGIDGGSTYSKHFNTEDLLANGRKSFDDQFSEFRFAERQYGVSIKPIL
jgi:hypothetical protein